jgi:hypothetical protein
VAAQCHLVWSDITSSTGRVSSAFLIAIALRSSALACAWSLIVVMVHGGVVSGSLVERVGMVAVVSVVAKWREL